MRGSATVVVLIVVLVVIAVAVGVLLARRGAGGVQRRIEARLDGQTVERQAKATFYGLQSAGAGQVRGLGVLALTPTELLFLQFVPDREVHVARTAITSVRREEEFLGKTQGRPLLVVAWTDGEGSEEAAWDVPDLDEWESRLAG